MLFINSKSCADLTGWSFEIDRALSLNLYDKTYHPNTSYPFILDLSFVILQQEDLLYCTESEMSQTNLNEAVVEEDADDAGRLADVALKDLLKVVSDQTLELGTA